MITGGKKDGEQSSVDMAVCVFDDRFGLRRGDDQ
jgi:hypothetical protein